jgi:hypothetical protein
VVIGLIIKAHLNKKYGSSIIISNAPNKKTKYVLQTQDIKLLEGNEGLSPETLRSFMETVVLHKKVATMICGGGRVQRYYIVFLQK